MNQITTPLGSGYTEPGTTSFSSLCKSAEHCPFYRKLETYYEGEARLDALGVSLPPNMRILELMAPFPKMSIDILTEVLNPAGFILGEDRDITDILRRWWSINDMDTTINNCLTEALVQGAAYLVVGYGDDYTPRITAHDRRGIATRFDHQGNLVEALRLYKNGDRDCAAHYIPGFVIIYTRNQANQWVEVDRIETGVSRPTIVPVFNRVRLKDSRGRSELLDIISITDAASRSLTNLQVAAETLAMPQRYIFSTDLAQSMYGDDGGWSRPKPADVKPDPQVERLKMYMSSLWVGPDGAQAGQFPGADLSQLQNSYKMYAQIVSAITGIPPAMLGISTDNPSSAEAMRVAKDRLIARAETKQSMFGDAIEEVMRIALDMYKIRPYADTQQLEMQWRDPATASESARQASLLQAHAQGVIDAETAREGLRLTPEQMARERKNATNFFGTNLPGVTDGSDE